jgi:hypothetical protein
MGEPMDTLMGSCSQNTLKNKRLEYQSYRQERKFMDRERLSGEMHRRVWKADPIGVGGYVYMYMVSTLI